MKEKAAEKSKSKAILEGDNAGYKTACRDLQDAQADIVIYEHQLKETEKKTIMTETGARAAIDEVIKAAEKQNEATAKKLAKKLLELYEESKVAGEMTDKANVLIKDLANAGRLPIQGTGGIDNSVGDVGAKALRANNSFFQEVTGSAYFRPSLEKPYGEIVNDHDKIGDRHFIDSLSAYGAKVE